MEMCEWWHTGTRMGMVIVKSLKIETWCKKDYTGRVAQAPCEREGH